MAYSQVEVASSFDCVHNRRERCNTMTSTFQKNLKELVRDHLCISVSSVSEDEEKNSESSQNHQNLTCISKDKDSSHILDQWAAKQAEEMVSTIQTDQESSSSSSENLGASSLVQMWEARLHPAHIRVDRSNSFRNSPRSAVAPGAVAPGTGTTAPPRLLSRSSSSKTSPSSGGDFPYTKLDFVGSTGSSTRTSGVNEDLFVGLDAGDQGESERLRIADIIKRLESDNSNENEQGNSSTISDLKSFSLVVNVNSLKIRGRQAFNDLLVQMEQERKKELSSIVDRGSVSKFAHRGRIQSMLRVRSLERGKAIQKSAQCTTPSHANRSHHCSTIMSLRERFSRDGTSRLTPRNGKEIENRLVDNENRNTTHHQGIQSNECGDVSVTNPQASTSKSCKEINVDHKNDHVAPNFSSTSKSGKEIADHNNNQNGSTIFDVMMKTDNDNRDFCTSDNDDAHEGSSARSDVTWQGTGSELNNFGASSSMNNWENGIIDDYKQDFEDMSYDWFSGIARPRSYWEDLRSGWYEQMLTCSSEDNEIKQLLQRKTVSSFLAGEFRAKMDQMIMSHVQVQASHEDQELEEESHARMGQLIMSLLQRQPHSSGADSQEQRGDVDADADDKEEEDDDDDDEEEDDNEQEAIEDHESMYRQSAFSSWNNSNHQQVANYSEQVSHPSEVSTNQDERLVLPLNHPSNIPQDMELKEQMEQLQRDMYELRKAMQASLEMQSQLRSSIQQEAARNSDDITRRERKCCICYDKQVDTFLYRCGHMCTCLRCANELQWSSGKCPICRAPILDVVRAYMDS